MSRDFSSKDEAFNKLFSTIKDKFEEDGVLQEVRCLLQTKMIAMMKDESRSLVQRPHLSEMGKDYAVDSRIMLLHQLIMEYLHWHGFHYTAEMFSLESTCENTKPIRECLEGVLGNFEHKDVPILLQLVAELMAKQSQTK